MLVKQDKLAAFLLSVVFAGVTFMTSLGLASWMFGIEVSPIQWWQYIVIGNISVILTGLALSFIERITVKVIEKEVLNRR